MRESYLTDLYVLTRYADFLAENYNAFWSRVIKHEFSESWSSLQDAIDTLRLIKRFSTMHVGFFESQLLEVREMLPNSLQGFLQHWHGRRMV